jgi:hypothetical protein
MVSELAPILKSLHRNGMSRRSAETKLNQTSDKIGAPSLRLAES